MSVARLQPEPAVTRSGLGWDYGIPSNAADAFAVAAGTTTVGVLGDLRVLRCLAPDPSP